MCFYNAIPVVTLCFIHCFICILDKLMVISAGVFCGIEVIVGTCMDEELKVKRQIVMKI